MAFRTGRSSIPPMAFSFVLTTRRSAGGVELLAFGIKTGKQLAIKGSNVRRILPDAKPVLPEADDADVYPGKFADESWSDDSWGERDPKWRAAVKTNLIPRAVRGQQQARRSGHVVVVRRLGSGIIYYSFLLWLGDRRRCRSLLYSEDSSGLFEGGYSVFGGFGISVVEWDMCGGSR